MREGEIGLKGKQAATHEGGWFIRRGEGKGKTHGQDQAGGRTRGIPRRGQGETRNIVGGDPDTIIIRKRCIHFEFHLCQ